MKKLFTLSALAVMTLFILSGCSRRGVLYDEDYWLTRERGVVVYSDDYCPYYVVETRSGYTIINSQSGRTPVEGTVIYGDLSLRGSSEFYNYSDGYLVRGNVKDYWLSYFDAQNRIDFYCY